MKELTSPKDAEIKIKEFEARSDTLLMIDG
jgi:hypothetical protein